MNDPWTWTTVWGLTEGAGVWDGQRRAKGENWGNCNRIKKKRKPKQLTKRKKKRKKRPELCEEGPSLNLQNSGE